MPIPTSKPLSLSAVQTEYGGTNPISMSEYRGLGNAPASGAIDLWGDFNGTANEVAITATGGSISDSGGYRYHTFTSGGTFTVTGEGIGSGFTTLDILVVGAGGSPSTSYLRGGGGGGVQTATITPAISETFVCTVAPSSSGSDGGSSYVTCSNTSHSIHNAIAGGGSNLGSSGSPQSNARGSTVSYVSGVYTYDLHGGGGGAGGTGGVGGGSGNYYYAGNGGSGYLWLDGNRYGGGGGGSSEGPSAGDLSTTVIAGSGTHGGGNGYRKQYQIAGSNASFYGGGGGGSYPGYPNNGPYIGYQGVVIFRYKIA